MGLESNYINQIAANTEAINKLISDAKKIQELDPLGATPALADLVAVYNVSTNSTVKVTIEQFFGTFTSDQIQNLSNVTGATVTDALNEILNRTKWRGNWIPIAYNRRDQVRDGNYIAIANTDTSDRPAPQNVGPSYSLFDGSLSLQLASGASNVLTGIRHTATTDGFTTSARLFGIAGQKYKLYHVIDPLGTPVVHELGIYEASATGWVEFGIPYVELRNGDTHDFIFEATNSGPDIRYDWNLAYYIGNPNTKGLFAVDDVPENIAQVDSGYGLDVIIQDATISYDWDIQAGQNGISGGPDLSNYVDLVSDQSIAGEKTFTEPTYGFKFVTNGGSATDFVKGDGTLDNTVYATKLSVDNLDTRVTQNEVDITNLQNGKLDDVNAGIGIQIDKTNPLEPIISSIPNSTAGIFNYIFFTGDTYTTPQGTFYQANRFDEGTVAEVMQTVSVNDNQTQWFGQDLLGPVSTEASNIQAGDYSGELAVKSSITQSQIRFTVEVYLCDVDGLPFDSGITGNPIGDLGFQVLAILTSGNTDMQGTDVVTKSFTGFVPEDYIQPVNTRGRYHIAATKVGTAGGPVNVDLYYGYDYAGHVAVPVSLTTDNLENKSNYPGATQSDVNNSILTYQNTVRVNSFNTRTGDVLPLVGDYSGFYLGINDTADDSAKLGGELPGFYLDYGNITNPPTIPSGNFAYVDVPNIFTVIQTCGVAPTLDQHLANKGYVDGAIVTALDDVAYKGQSNTFTQPQLIAGNLTFLNSDDKIRFVGDTVAIYRDNNGMRFDSYNGYVFYDTLNDRASYTIGSTGNHDFGQGTVTIGNVTAITAGTTFPLSIISTIGTASIKFTSSATTEDIFVGVVGNVLTFWTDGTARYEINSAGNHDFKTGNFVNVGTINTVSHGNSANWFEAYGWGNHADEGYLTSFTETDPTVPSHVKAITTNNITEWTIGFDKSVSELNFDTANGNLEIITENGTSVSENLDGRYSLTDTTYAQATSTVLGLVKIGFPESGKDYPVELNVDGQMFVNVPWTDTQIPNTDNYVNSVSFNTTNGVLTLGRTGGLGSLTESLDGRYLTSFTESDPTVPGHVKGITTGDIANWDEAHGWGDHALAGYLTQEYHVDSAGFSTTSGVLNIYQNGLAPVAVDLDGRWLLISDYVDTNTWRPVVAGGNTLGATETLTFVAGANISITESAGNVTINANVPAGANDYVDGVSFNTTNGVLTLTRTGSLANLTADLDGRYLETESDPTVPGHVKAITSNQITEWNIAFDHSPSEINFDTVTGDLELVTEDGSTYIENLDGRYSRTDTTYGVATSSVLGLVKIGFPESGKNYPVELNGSNQMFVNVPWSDTDTNTWRPIIAGGNTLGSSETLTFVAGSNVTITESNGSVTINSSYVNTNYYVSSASFNTTNGILTLNRSGLSAVTVDLDGRYITSYSETDTLQSVTSRGAETSVAMRTTSTMRANGYRGGGHGSTIMNSWGAEGVYLGNNGGTAIGAGEWNNVLINNASSADERVNIGAENGLYIYSNSGSNVADWATRHTTIISANAFTYGGNNVFHDGYHPNADKWTTGRTLTVSLSGDVTGSNSQTIDGSANKTFGVSVQIGANVVNANELNVSGNGSAGQVLTSDGDGTFSWTNKTVNTNTNYYVSSVSFSTSTGVLTLNRSGLSALTVDLDGRWLDDGANAVSASKWQTARTITLGGDLTGSVSIDGSANVTLSAQVNNDSHTHNQLVYRTTSDGTLVSSFLTNRLTYGESDATGTGYATPYGAWLSVIYNTNRGFQLNGGKPGDLYVRGVESAQTNGFSPWYRIFNDNYHPNADKWTTARTIGVTLSGEVTGSATQSVDGSANKTITVATTIAANVVGANELNVSGNGTTSQYLRSDGDGTFSWATPPNTNYYANSLAFDTGTGVLTLGRSGLSALTVDLDGRYLTSAPSNMVTTNTAQTITGSKTYSANLKLNDNRYLYFGNSNDVEMYFSGTNFYMDLNNGEDFTIRDGNSSNATRFTFKGDEGDFTAIGNVEGANIKRTGGTGDQVLLADGNVKNLSEFSGAPFQKTATGSTAYTNTAGQTFYYFRITRYGDVVTMNIKLSGTEAISTTNEIVGRINDSDFYPNENVYFNVVQNKSSGEAAVSYMYVDALGYIRFDSAGSDGWEHYQYICISWIRRDTNYS